MHKKDLTYSKAIEQVMIKNGYFAPLKLIYKHIWKYKDKTKIKGITPNFTIQAIVQRDSRFTRIGLGVYALTEYLDRLPKEIEPKNENERKERKHAIIQGMLLEIGNFKKEISDTYTNDKKWIFQGKKLGNLSTIENIPDFTYKNIINNSARFIDVIWFNERRFPFSFFEVEHSTDFRDALIKFYELQDFYAKFYCVSEQKRYEKFQKEINKSAFKPLINRVKFLPYDQVENDYKIALRRTYL